MRTITFAIIACLTLVANAASQNGRTVTLLDDNWKFSLGYAGNPAKDFGHGTEYFTYLAKVRANNDTKSPMRPKFNDSTWQTVNVPHDWAVDLPFAPEASHSHGYKTIGWKYPETSVGWYRRHFTVDKADSARHVEVRFDGIFRDAQVFCNGFFLGHEPSGYATQTYDITDYLNFDGENVLTVRADASMEEGWYYEGAGIYRHVWLIESGKIHVSPMGTYVTETFNKDFSEATVKVETKIMNDGLSTSNFTVRQRIIDNEGNESANSGEIAGTLEPKGEKEYSRQLKIDSPHLWDTENPYLYTLLTEVSSNGKVTDTYTTKIGLRKAEWSADSGFSLNGHRLQIKGVNLHQDHAGVGTGIRDELWRYRIAQLKKLGCNAIRSSHNPASPALLDICDQTGMLMIDENRAMGINCEQTGQMRKMMERDRNHPCIILWSIGNEEWAIENNSEGEKTAASMTSYAHQIDSTRPTTVGNAGGTVLLRGVDVKGYNYIIQNDIDGQHERYGWMGTGTEETTGCGTRDCYFTDINQGCMAALNRSPQKGTINEIERGMKFYNSRKWLGGLFFWTGFDYRGEPNPLAYPATGSQFGLLDYCGFPKDEAFYLQSWWTDKPTLHLLPHWNLYNHEGEPVSVWAYSNCDEVELTVNGKNIGRQKMPKYGHLEWNTTYQPGKIEAKGYIGGKKVLNEIVETTDDAQKIEITPHKSTMQADGQDMIVLDISLLDGHNRKVHDANYEMQVKVEGTGEILGWGNGNPGFKADERPTSEHKYMNFSAFNGKAQVLITSIKGKSGNITVSITGNSLKPANVKLIAK